MPGTQLAKGEISSDDVRVGRGEVMLWFLRVEVGCLDLDVMGYNQEIGMTWLTFLKGHSDYSQAMDFKEEIEQHSGSYCSSQGESEWRLGLGH